jgi:hypothetical protein
MIRVSDVQSWLLRVRRRHKVKVETESWKNVGQAP